MKIDIRNIEQKDMAFLEDMLYQAIYVQEGQEPPSRDIINQPELKKYIEGFGNETDCGFVAINKDTGQPIGAIWLRLFTEENKGWGFLDTSIPEVSLAVDKSFRGMGVGTDLIEHLLEMTAMEYPSISLSVDPENRAVQLYERFGFVRCGKSGTSITMRLDR